MSEILESFIAKNKEELVAEFIQAYDSSWKDFCNMKLREAKE